MSVGSMTNALNTQSVHGIGSSTLYRAGAVSGSTVTFDFSQTTTTAWTFGTGAGKFNQALRIIFTAVKNTTTSLDLSGVLTDFLLDPLSTLSLVKLLHIEYLTTAQDATNGNASTADVTMQPGASNPIITSPLGAAETFVMKPGSKFFWEDPSNGFTVTGGSADTLDFVHSDNVLDAHLRITILGEK